MASLAALLEESAARHPDREALVLGETRLSYAEVDAAANQVANLLVDLGVTPGDTVALSCPNLPWFTFVYYGVLKAGGVVVPLNVLFKGREIAYHLADSEARVYVCFEGTPDLPMAVEGKKGFDATDSCETMLVVTADPTAASPVEGVETLAGALQGRPTTYASHPADSDDVAVILYTSGTTGQPKGAELRHRNMVDNAMVGSEIFGADPERPDVFLCVLPLFHSFGQTVIQNAAFAFGGTVVLLPRFEAKAALALMEKEQVTFFAGVPTMYWGLLGALEAGADATAITEHLRIAASGGSPLPVEVHRAFAERFGVTILEGYGLSETSPIASFTPYDGEVRVGSIGLPIPGVEMKLIEPDWTETEPGPEAIGEVCIKGHDVMKGYHNRPEATAEAIHDGWFRSGDLGRRDDDGYYYIVDRAKDMILRGGYNVYPREIEEVLITHPEVSLAAVIGVPDDKLGEEIKAYVIVEPGSAVTPEELVAWGREQMASYKYPRSVVVVPDLPMTATGKILKRELD